MLKREPIAAIFVVAEVLEPIAWHKRLTAQYKQLQPSDFEVRDIEIITPKGAHWDELTERLSKQRHSTIMVAQELGGLILLPIPPTMSLSTLTTLLLSLHAINTIRIFSAYTKMQQVKSNFGEIIANAARGDVGIWLCSLTCPCLGGSFSATTVDLPMNIQRII